MNHEAASAEGGYSLQGQRAKRLRMGQGDIRMVRKEAESSKSPSLPSRPGRVRRRQADRRKDSSVGKVR